MARSSLQGALSLHDATLATAARQAFISGAQIAFIVCAAILVVAAVLARLTVPAGVNVTEDPAIKASPSSSAPSGVRA